MHYLLVFADFLALEPIPLKVQDLSDTTIDDLIALVHAKYSRRIKRLDVDIGDLQMLLAPADLLCDPDETLLDRVHSVLESGTAKRQLLMTDLSTLFTPEQLDDDRVHLILDVIPVEEPDKDILGVIPMYKAREAAEAAARSTAAPSSVARNIATYRKEQNVHPIYNGCNDRTAPSVKLYHTAFATFCDRMKNLDAIDITDVTATERTSIVDILTDCSTIPAAEDDLVISVFTHISRLVGAKINRRRLEENTRVVVRYADQELGSGLQSGLVIYGEGKPALGINGDPALQASLTYRDHVFQSRYADVRNASSCPCIILALAGPYLCVLGAVLTPRPVVEHLTGYIYIGMGPSNEQHALFLTRFFRALREMVESLQDYYKKLTPSATPIDAALFPHPTFPYTMSAEDKGLADRLVYESWFAYEGKKSDDFQRALYRGSLDGRPVVIKFCERYGAAAHRLLAQAGLAPMLHLATPVGGGFYMVVMEYVEGQTAFTHFRSLDIKAKKYIETPLSPGVRRDVERAVEALHAGGFVFGDLRRPNILVTADGEGAMLIDFDWAGTAGQSRYPFLINNTGAIDWAQGVVAGGILEEEHDREMMRKL